MAFEPSTLSRIVIPSALLVLPIIAWLLLYLAERWWSINWLPALPWLKTIRWIGWTVGTALFLLSLISGRVPWVYGVAMTGFSAGLSIPESWIKRRLLS